MSDTDDFDFDSWPDCPVPGCPNKCCRALDSAYCFPHTKGHPYVKKIKIEFSHMPKKPAKENA
ncbi:hypothetical protein COB52_00035 [Candidatus Kaiserbacteria bacterium]|nr:MAG: hypothetical protein COB52_00035 [Candidatus Kaiserbacteria bacterium]